MHIQAGLHRSLEGVPALCPGQPSVAACLEPHACGTVGVLTPLLGTIAYSPRLSVPLCQATEGTLSRDRSRREAWQGKCAI